MPFAALGPSPGRSGWPRATAPRPSRRIHRFVTKFRVCFLTLDRMPSDAPLTFEQREGRAPGTRIYRLAGPLTLRNLFEFQAALRSQPEPRTTVLDLSAVPYMDSAGMGAIINYYVHCQKEGAALVVAGVSSRVMELFKMTKVDSIIPLRDSIADAEVDA
jgi:anti-sigma B factor antagonist